ncbi:MAG TPA: substrate-binding domain-containing protein, partial [Victivallales bacterium]|nr:substrate-binding domain-containing protein [Victivallales bacterium]
GNYLVSYNNLTNQKEIEVCYIAEALQSAHTNIIPFVHLVFDVIYYELVKLNIFPVLKILNRKIENTTHIAKNLSPDAVIIAAIGLNESIIKELLALKRHIIWFEEYRRVLPGVTISTDNFLAGKMAGKYLVEQGCKNFLYLTYAFDKPYYISELRFDGFLSGIREHCTSSAISSFPCFYKSPNFKKELLKMIRNYDGIFCFTDRLALIIKKILSEEGINSPQDYILIAVGPPPQEDNIENDINLIVHPIDKIGRKIAQNTKQILSGEKVQGIIKIPPELNIKSTISSSNMENLA